MFYYEFRLKFFFFSSFLNVTDLAEWFYFFFIKDFKYNKERERENDNNRGE